MYFNLRIVLLISIIAASNAEIKLKTRVTPFAESFATILGAFSATGVFAVISPLILKLAIIPLFTIIKLLSKPLIYMGLTGYLMVAFTPLILAKSGMTSPVFTSRAESNGWLSSFNSLMSTNMSTIASETLNFFNIDNEECKIELSCKIGKRLANNPYIYVLILQSGAKDWIENKYMANIVKSATDSQKCNNSCKSLISGEELRYTTTTTSSTSPPSSLDTLNEIIEWFGK